jgi:hypothetical protein
MCRTLQFYLAYNIFHNLFLLNKKFIIIISKRYFIKDFFAISTFNFVKYLKENDFIFSF